MRIIAIDTSGSNMSGLAALMLDHAKEHFTHPKDAVVFFDSGGVTKAVWLSEATSSDIRGGGGEGIPKLIEWMDGRSFHSTDELIVYHDGMLHFEDFTDQLSKTWFKLSFKLLREYAHASESDIAEKGIEVQVLPF